MNNKNDSINYGLNDVSNDDIVFDDAILKYLTKKADKTNTFKK